MRQSPPGSRAVVVAPPRIRYNHSEEVPEAPRTAVAADAHNIEVDCSDIGHSYPDYMYSVGTCRNR